MRTIKSWPARLFAKLFVLFLSLTMLGTWSGNAMAANCISIAASNWNVQTTWGPAGTGCAGATGGIPGAADTVTIATNVSMNVASTTVSALTINSGSTLTLNATPLIVSGNITNNGTITAGGTDILQSTGATAVLSGSGTFAGSARLYFSGATPNIAAGAVQTFTGTTNRVYVGSNNGTTVNSVLTINGTLASTVANGNFLRIYGTSGVTVAAAGVINASTSTITYRSANETVTNNGTVSIATVTGNNATTSIWTNAANSTLNVYTTLLSTGTLNASATGNTVNYAGAAQAIKAPSAAGYYHLTFSGSGAKTSPASNLLVNGNVTFLAGSSATFAAGTSRTHTFLGSWIVNTTAATPFSYTTTSILNFNTPATPAATSIGGTTVATLAFNTVNINNTSGVNLNENASFSGTLTVGAGATLTPAAAAVVSGGGTLTGTGTAAVTTLVAGGFSAQYTITTKTVTNLTISYAGAGAQTVTAMTYGSGAGGGLTINNASGVSLAGNTTVAGTLTLTSGVVNAAGFTLTASGDCTTTVKPSLPPSSGWVAGNLQLSFPIGSPTCTYHVGDATTYRPILQAFASVTATGPMVGSVSQAVGEAPNIASSGLDSSKDVNRYWTINKPTGSTITYTTYSATFTFVAADYDVGANTANFEVEGSLGGGAVWITTAIGSRTATTNQATGIAVPNAANTYYNFAVGEKKATNPGDFEPYDIGTLPAAALTGGLYTKIAGAAFTFDIAALNPAKTALFTTFVGPVKVELIDSHDNSGPLDANGCRNTWTTVIQTLANQTFNAAGDAAITGAAGRHRVTPSVTESNAWKDVRVRVSFPASGAATSIGCSTDRFAIRPNNLVIIQSDGVSFGVTDSNWQTAGTTRNLNNVAASGGNVHKAGQPFTISATAYNAAAAITTNYAGSPDTVTLTACAGTACTASFGAVALGTWATNPGPGANGKVQTTTATYSEAGAFNLTLKDTTFAAVDSSDPGATADCSAAGYYVCSAATSVGRFVPDHFDVMPLITPVFKTFGTGCTTTPFTYIGQPFGYLTTPQATILARNSAGVTVTNYSGALLWKVGGATPGTTKDCLTSPDPNTCKFTTSWSAGGNSSSVAETYAYTLTPASTPNWDNAGAVVGTATVTAGTGANIGTGTLAISSSNKLAFLRNTTTPQASFTASITDSISVTDSSESGVAGNGTIATATPLVFNGTGSGIAFDSGHEFRYGRLKLSNAYGSELLPIIVPVTAYSWQFDVPSSTYSWQVNTDDNCTALTPGTLAIGNVTKPAGSALAFSTPPTGVAGYPSATLTGGTTYLRITPATAGAGSADIALNLTGTTTDVSCNTTHPTPTTGASLLWLQGNWCGVAGYVRDPNARIKFGSPKAPYIYLRERY